MESGVDNEVDNEVDSLVVRDTVSEQYIVFNRLYNTVLRMI